MPKTLFVLVGFLIGQIIDNFFSQPFIFSNTVKSHPLEIFILILAAGTLTGPVGMIFAIPLYTSLKVIGQEFLPKNIQQTHTMQPRVKHTPQGSLEPNGVGARMNARTPQYAAPKRKETFFFEALARSTARIARVQESPGTLAPR